MPPPPSLVVFDMDGVLVDVSASYRAAIARTVAALEGGVVAEGEIQTLKNAGGFNNDWDLSRELLRRRGQEVPRKQVIEVFNHFFLGRDGDGLIQQERWLLPAELLAELRQRFRLAIFTGRPRADADLTLRRFGAADAFERVIGLEDVAAPKPDPEGLLRLRRECAPAPLAAYIGDTVDDARCALAAGVRFIGVAVAGAGDNGELAGLFHQSGAERVVNHVAVAARHLLASTATDAPAPGA